MLASSSLAKAVAKRIIFVSSLLFIYHHLQYPVYIPLVISHVSIADMSNQTAPARLKRTGSDTLGYIQWLKREDLEKLNVPKLLVYAKVSS